ncbi:hypothetical protein [Parasitella parasitica]|uniref:FAD/NAD(P)-binding domain-containing protein n=1 Tax=Parasitella parasitica TaxID=35722 RepID=A0A0B7N954_9FUNG|nr:hypothetical protein [Parasitella parasitica]
MTKNIVIVGGGFAGTAVAGALEKALAKSNDQEYRIILVEKKSHFYHAIAGLRSAVLDWDSRILIPYTDLFHNKRNKVVQASVVQLEKGEILLDQSIEEFGDRVAYDYLVLATGTHYPSPAKASALTYEATHANLESLRASVKSAKSIVIVGGGPVGIELAGEIRDVYAEKKITIVHAKDNFLDEASSPNVKLRRSLLTLAQKNQIDTIFNDSVDLPSDLKNHFYSPEDGIVKTNKGQMIENVDLVLLAFGNRPETAWLKNSSLGTEILNANGYIKVKKTFQVDHADLSNVFVLGDAADLSETKLAYRIGAHAPVVVENLVQIAVKKGKPTAEYKKGPDAMFITFGKKQGAGVLPFFGGLTQELGYAAR